MKRRLPKGEETLPIAKRLGRYITPEKLDRGLSFKPASTKLLIKRMEMRIDQGRVLTIYRLQHEMTPDEQLRHMKLGDEMGLELIEAERKLLEEELKIIREEYGDS